MTSLYSLNIYSFLKLPRPKDGKITFVACVVMPN